jgi:hypothetical protein
MLDITRRDGMTLMYHVDDGFVWVLWPTGLDAEHPNHWENRDDQLFKWGGYIIADGADWWPGPVAAEIVIGVEVSGMPIYFLNANEEKSVRAIWNPYTEELFIKRVVE